MDIYGNDQGNLLVGTAYADTIRGYAGNDTLFGGKGGDTLYGGSDHDQLFGEDGGDVLWGGSGYDILNPGTGYDEMHGGADGDIFQFSAIADTWTILPLWPYSSGTVRIYDRIVDFQDGVDGIDLSGIDANLYAAGNQAFSFIGTAPFSGTPGEVRYYHSAGNTYIELQTGTSVDIEGAIRLDGIHTPDLTWFSL
jgi:serralysin